MLPRYVQVDNSLPEIVNIDTYPNGILKEYIPLRNAVIVEFQNSLNPIIHIECVNQDKYLMLRNVALDIYHNMERK